MGNLLEVKEVKKYYPVNKGFLKKKEYVKAVDSVSFNLKEGEVFGIVGESGCGKSTLGKVLCKLDDSTSGEIILDGVNITGLSDRKMRPMRRKIQMVFQDPYSSLNTRMSVGNIIAEPIKIHKLTSSEKETNDRVIELMEEVGLSSYHINRYPHEFSGGQRQRIGIARALAVEPKLIIADEPVSALDVSIQSQVLNVMNELKKKHNLTYIFIAHDLSVVEHISDRVGVMYLGDFVEIAEKRSLYSFPHHPYTQALMAAVPVLDPRARKERTLLEGNIPSALNPPKGCKFHTRCPKCMDICSVKAPEKVEVRDNHFVYCHLYNETNKE